MRSVDSTPNKLGTVYLPQSGTQVGKFQFIVDSENADGRKVEVGSVVAADTREGTIVGTVVDMRTVGSDGDPVRIVPARDAGAQVGYLDEAVVADVQVVASDRLRSVRSGNVRPAGKDEVSRATGSASMDWPIATGVIPLVEGGWAPLHLDGSFLLGPEAQGCLVGGRSGVASKTSFTSVLMRSVIAAGDDDKHRTAILAFNVKGTDLTSIDKPPAPGYELTEDDLAIYAAMGIPATPFPDVTYWAPSRTGFGGVSSSRSDARALSWDLKMAWRFLRFFFPALYDDDKMASFVAQFEDLLLHNPDPSKRIDTFDKMAAWFNAQIAEAEEEGLTECWNKRVHIATMRRMRRQFDGLRARGGGLFTGGSAKPGDDVPDTGWRNGQVVVIDVAGLPTEVQGFVIARTVDRVMASAERGELGVDHLAIVMDELNAFAPSVGSEMSTVRKTLQKVATQGRYAGLALFGCAQQLSKIDELLRDNCATKALGSSAEAELTSGVHGRLASGQIERIATLPKGQMAIWHTAYRQNLVGRFPRPAWQMGKSKTSGATSTDTRGILAQHIGEASVRRLSEGIPDDVADTIIATSSSVQEATERLAEHREADMSKVALHAKTAFDPTNPFDLS